MPHVFCSVSAKELDSVRRSLLPSLERQQGVDEIQLHLVDYSGGASGPLQADRANTGRVKIAFLTAGKALGFGEAHNFAFRQVRPDSPFVIINPDVYAHERCLAELLARHAAGIGLVEARQLPFPHPKEYDPRTNETPWASGCCVLADPDFFQAAGGFDERFWMYTEDVDLSWRAWLNDYAVIHHPPASVYHFTGVYFSYEPTRYYLEHFWSARNFIYLMRKYWGKPGETEALRRFAGSGYPEPFIRAVTEDYQAFEQGLPEGPLPFPAAKLKTLRDKIKVLGFNQFHEMRA